MSNLDVELAECSDIASVAACGLRYALAAAGTQLGNVRCVDWKTGNLELVAHEGFTQEFLDSLRIVTRMDGSSPGRAVALRRAVVIEDVEKDEGAQPHIGLVRRAGFRAVQSTPLISSKGPICGVLSTHYAKPGRPTEAQLLRIADIAAKIADAMLRVRSASS
jgi:GAF domain-containing protein